MKLSNTVLETRSKLQEKSKKIFVWKARENTKPKLNVCAETEFHNREM